MEAQSGAVRVESLAGVRFPAGPPDPALSDVAAKIEAVGRFEPDKDKEMTFTIPPRARGLVSRGLAGRQEWHEYLYGHHWDQNSQQARDMAAELKTMVRWVNPAYVAYPIFYVGEFPASELQKQAKVENVYVYSTTRLTLRPKEAALVSKWKAEESPIIVGEPEYMMPPYTWLENRLKRLLPRRGRTCSSLSASCVCIGFRSRFRNARRTRSDRCPSVCSGRAFV